VKRHILQHILDCELLYVSNGIYPMEAEAKEWEGPNDEKLGIAIDIKNGPTYHYVFNDIDNGHLRNDSQCWFIAKCQEGFTTEIGCFKTVADNFPTH